MTKSNEMQPKFFEPKLLRLDLQHFAEGDPTDPQGGQGDPQGGAGGGQAGNTDPQGKQDPQGQNPPENMIPKSRFDEVNNKFKELQDQLDKINKQKEQDELDSKKKKGEFEELFNNAQNELETYKTQSQQTSERVTELEGIIQTLVDAELEAVPEELRDLVPANFTPEQKLSWINTAKQKGLFGTQTNPKEDEQLGGATNNQQQQQVDVSKMSVAEMLRSAYGKK